MNFSARIGLSTAALCVLFGLTAWCGIHSASDSFATTLIVLLSVGGAIAAAGSFLGVRSAARQLRQLAGEMLDGSRQVAAASGQVAVGPCPNRIFEASQEADPARLPLRLLLKIKKSINVSCTWVMSQGLK